MLTNKSNKVGIIIGVNKYKNFGPLRFATNDAIDLYEALIEHCGYQKSNLHLFIDDDLSSLDEDRRKKYDDYLRNETAERPYSGAVTNLLEENTKSNIELDEFLFYFSGHGRYSGAKSKSDILSQSYLIFKDTHTTQAGNLQEALSLEALKNKYMSKIKAKCKLIILDACHASLSKGDPDDPMREEFEEALNAMLENGWAILSGCRRGELAHEEEFGQSGNGIFTHFLVEGLTGEALRDKSRKEIYLEDLKINTYDKVVEFCKEKDLQQTPVYFANLSTNVVISTVPNHIDEKEKQYKELIDDYKKKVRSLNDKLKEAVEARKKIEEAIGIFQKYISILIKLGEEHKREPAPRDQPIGQWSFFRNLVEKIKGNLILVFLLIGITGVGIYILAKLF